MRCNNCGAECDGDSTFCKNCGSRIGTEEGMPKRIVPETKGTINGTPLRQVNTKTVCIGEKECTLRSVVAFVLVMVSLICLLLGKIGVDNLRILFAGQLAGIVAVVIAVDDLMRKGEGKCSKLFSKAALGITAAAIVVGMIGKGNTPRQNRDSYSATQQNSYTQSYREDLQNQTEQFQEEMANIRDQVISEIQETATDALNDAISDAVNDAISDTADALNDAISDTTETLNDAANDVRDSVTEASQTAESESLLAGVVTPSFKETMDSYEAFFDEYIAFMSKYMSGGATGALDMMNDYLDFMTKYEEAMNALDGMDTDSMSPADSAYYFEVMTRIEMKLLSVAYGSLGR